MRTVTNKLPVSVFSTSPEMRLVIHKTDRTPTPRRLESLTAVVIPSNTKIAGWRLKSAVLVQLRRTRKQCVAATWLEGLTEYGTGKTEVDAIADLLVSLGEYKTSLKKRKSKLGESAQNELAAINNLLERSK